MKCTTRSLMFMTLSILYIGEVMAMEEKRFDGVDGPFAMEEFFSYYTADVGKLKWEEAGEKRLDGAAGPFSLPEFLDFYEKRGSKEEGLTRWKAAGEKRLDGGEGPFTLDQFIEYYGKTEKARKRWEAAAPKVAATPVGAEKVEYENGTAKLTSCTFNKAAIEDKRPNPKGYAKGSKVAEVKKFTFTKKNFKLNDALEFKDRDFQDSFISSFRAFAETHKETAFANGPKHIWFEFKTIANEDALKSSTPIEWVLIALETVHEFAPRGTNPKTSTLNDPKLTFWALRDGRGEGRGTVRVNNPDWKTPVHVCPKNLGEHEKEGWIDLSTSGLEGSRVLNMANFFRQSTKGDVIELMKATFQLAKDKLTTAALCNENKNRNIHIYAFAGSRPWLHMRVEAELEKPHPLWY